MPLLLMPYGSETPKVQIGAWMWLEAMEANQGRYHLMMNNLSVLWQYVQPSPPPADWTWTWLDTAVDQLYSRGCRINMHLVCSSPWGAQAPPVGSPLVGMPPLNIADYNTFVWTVADRYKGKGVHYSIENEVGFQDVYWGGTVPEYITLMEAAYAQIALADPGGIAAGTTVRLNDGVSAMTVVYTIAKVMIAGGGDGWAWGRKSVEHSPQWLAWWDAAYPDEAALVLYFATAEGTRVTGLIAAEIASGKYDHFQFHWYNNPACLTSAVDGLQTVLGTTPLELWELGYHYSSSADYSTWEFANTVAILMSCAVGEGLHSVMWFWWHDWIPVNPLSVGLTTTSGQWRVAAHTYCLLAERLHGLSPTGQSLAFHLGDVYIYSYNFGEFYIAYRTDVASPVSVDLTAVLPGGLAWTECKCTRLATQYTYGSPPTAVWVGTLATLIEEMPPPEVHTMLTERYMKTQVTHHLGVWPLAETERSPFRAYDLAANRRYGTYHDCLIGQNGPGDGLTAARLDGEVSYIDLETPSLVAAFNGDDGTVVLWAQEGSTESWHPTALSYLADFYVSATNRISLSCLDGTVTATRIANGVTASASASVEGSGWHQFAVVWGATGGLRIYVDSHLAVSTPNTQALIGTLVNAKLGRNANAADGYWRGRLARVALWKTPLTELEVDGLYPADWATWEGR